MASRVGGSFGLGASALGVADAVVNASVWGVRVSFAVLVRTVVFRCASVFILFRRLFPMIDPLEIDRPLEVNGEPLWRTATILRFSRRLASVELRQNTDR